jgi:hypothetical protein
MHTIHIAIFVVSQLIKLNVYIYRLRMKWGFNNNNNNNNSSSSSSNNNNNNNNKTTFNTTFDYPMQNMKNKGNLIISSVLRKCTLQLLGLWTLSIIRNSKYKKR